MSVLYPAPNIFLNPMAPFHLFPTTSVHSTAITLPVIICYYITQTALGHQSHTEHTQNELIILADRAISPLMTSLTQSETYFTLHFIKEPTN